MYSYPILQKIYDIFQDYNKNIVEKNKALDELSNGNFNFIVDDFKFLDITRDGFKINQLFKKWKEILEKSDLLKDQIPTQKLKMEMLNDEIKITYVNSEDSKYNELFDKAVDEKFNFDYEEEQKIEKEYVILEAKIYYIQKENAFKDYEKYNKLKRRDYYLDCLRKQFKLSEYKANKILDEVIDNESINRKVTTNKIITYDEIIKGNIKHYEDDNLKEFKEKIKYFEDKYSKLHKNFKDWRIQLTKEYLLKTYNIDFDENEIVTDKMMNIPIQTIISDSDIVTGLLLK